MRDFVNIHKLSLILNWNGADFEFKRPIKDEFGEPTEDTTTLGTVTGVFHKTFSGYTSLRSDTGATIESKKLPMILCLKPEFELVQGDFTVLNGKTYRVNAVNDLDETNKFAEISLEVVI